jgi:NAD(P)-dependent dehydrogenase (short-subunit alcohol dehydrogenase family)
MSDQDQKRIIIVGASSGLGRCLAVGLARRGAKVALLARRRDLLEEAAKEAGPRTRAITCDVTDESSCQNAVAEAATWLGGVDGMVYCPGIGILRRIEDLDLAAWRTTFDTNVAGASLFTAAALPHLAASSGVAVYLSSVSASFTAPWPGLASYTVTKAALDKLVEAWRAEHPNVGFTRVVVGDCAGGEGTAASQFMSGFDTDLLSQMFPVWLSRSLLAGTVYEVDQLVHAVDAVLRCGASATIPTVTVIPRQSAEAISLDELTQLGGIP